uniref:Uncharacterized protein n=1 Tax=Wuchereria bancrofti TaxID=6293 RepID=A0A1I8EN48_WUCBA
MGSTGSTMIDAIGIPILNLDKNATSETIRDLIMTLGHAQEIGDISTAIESSLYGNIKEVKWIQISDNNGYIIVFSNETEKEKAIKLIPGCSSVSTIIYKVQFRQTYEEYRDSFCLVSYRKRIDGELTFTLCSIAMFLITFTSNLKIDFKKT